MPNLKLWHIPDPKLTKELMRHEEMKKHEVKCYKIGNAMLSYLRM